MAKGIGASRVDFIAVPTKDLEKADKFYRETLGLDRNPNSTDSWVEYETGNVTLALVQPEQMGIPFNPLPIASIVLRVPDVEAARAALEEAGDRIHDGDVRLRGLQRRDVQRPRRQRPHAAQAVRAVR